MRDSFQQAVISPASRLAVGMVVIKPAVSVMEACAFKNPGAEATMV